MSTQPVYRCRHCDHPVPALALWHGHVWECPRCHNLLFPGMARRELREGELVDVVTCPYCRAESIWVAVESRAPHGDALVNYRCEQCARPFVVQHDPTVLVGPEALSEKERAWLTFFRWLRYWA